MVRNFGLADSTALFLFVNQHVGTRRAGAPSKHRLQLARSYWRHRVVVEIKPVVRQAFVGVGYGKITQVVVQLNLRFLLLLLLFLLLTLTLFAFLVLLFVSCLVCYG